MPEKVSLSFRDRNPDVLTSIANLSNDEVFTPPQLANQMLDAVEKAWAEANSGANIWQDPSVKFLDPFTKSGVFLREITRRLTEGLESTYPDLQERVNHITKNQVFGIAVTRLTSLLARRSVYCSKDATGKHSISRAFTAPQGNIWFESIEHTWEGGSTKVITADKSGNSVEKFVDGRCKYCRGSQKEYDRGKDLDSYAYALIHQENPVAFVAEIFGEEMKFDVIIGNPPYQLADGGGEGASAIPLYHRFVEQAIRLEPTLLTMVIPARWYSGGKGLDEFRNMMLTCGKISQIHDYPETEMCFPGVNIRGGVCYFVYDSQHVGPTEITNYSLRSAPTVSTRPLTIPSVNTFVRYNAAVSIVDKVRALGEPTLDTKVYSRNPFGIPSNFSAFETKPTQDAKLELYRSRRGSSEDKKVFVSEQHVVNNQNLINKFKVLVSKASPGGDEYPHAVLGRPLIAPPGSVCTETYLLISLVDGEAQGKNLQQYMSTRFFRFLVSLVKNTQNISKGSFALVPVQTLDKFWTDQELFAKYGLNSDEVAFIESLVRPMELENE